jgi:hypothetical protein
VVLLPVLASRDDVTDSRLSPLPLTRTLLIDPNLKYVNNGRPVPLLTDAEVIEELVS